MRIAIDSGGTFTDCISLDGGVLKVAKVFSTPANPGDAILEAIHQAVPSGAAIAVRHGTTVGTNALLERKGAKVAFVTTAGFEDTIAIGRQARQALYDWFMPPPPCLVPSALRFGVQERVSAEGAVLRAPTDHELDALREAIRRAARRRLRSPCCFPLPILRMSGCGGGAGAAGSATFDLASDPAGVSGVRAGFDDCGECLSCSEGGVVYSRPG